jgi:glycogen synthase
MYDMGSPKANVLFEVSWEVCNKVGGIYTVVKSKADLINSAYEDYYLIGPYVENKAKETFNEETPSKELAKIFSELAGQGITCYFGEWLIKGKPKVILMDVSKATDQINSLKKRYWDNYQIDSLNAEWTFEEPMLWSTAAGMLIEKFAQQNENKNIVTHCHEWMAGFAALHLKSVNANVGTVFTTHATMLGRTLCGSGRQLYEELEHLDPKKEAYNYNIQDKYLTELACAQNADVFTTVSEITSMEAEKILGRKADVLLLNGLDIEKFPSFEELSIKHRIYREKIREFVAYHFFPYYSFDLSQTLLFFIVGRYEFKNKGIDIFIKALGKLNQMMRENNSKKTIIVFFWIPHEVHGAKLELSENKMNYLHLKDFVVDNQKHVQQQILNHIIGSEKHVESSEHLSTQAMFSDEFLLGARKLNLKFKKQGNPLLVTHNLSDEKNDEIIKALLAEGLDNKEDDKVKAIFYPVYLTGVDGLIDLPYYDCLQGCHFGLFPSYYEPWGYTPLESAALGVPSLTTDLGGYGRFLLSKKEGNDGVYVLNRFGVNENKVINDFSKSLFDYTLLREKERVEQKMLAKKVAGLADWSQFVKFYFEAHNKALEKRGGN